MTKRYTRKLIVDRIRQQRGAGRKVVGSRQKTFRARNHAGGAEPVNFFKGKTMTIDEFIDSACLTLTRDSHTPTQLGEPIFMETLKERTTSLPKGVAMENDSYDVNDDRISKLMDVFGSNEKFYQCIRTLIQVDMFVQDNFDEFLKLQIVMNTTRQELLKTKRPRDVDDILSGLQNLTRLLGRQTLVYWININMTSKTRTVNQNPIRDIFRRLKPDYYFYIMFAKEPIKSMFSSIFKKSTQPPKYKYVISQENRKYIYDMMKDINRITQPEDMRRIMFDMDTVSQINFGKSGYDTAFKMMSKYSSAEYSSFTTNKWDTHIKFAPRTIFSYASEMTEVHGGDIDRERSKFTPDGSIMSCKSMQSLISAFKGETIARGGFDITLLSGFASDQKVYYRHQKISPFNPDVMKIYLPENSPYLGKYSDFETVMDDDAKSSAKSSANASRANMGIILYKYFLYNVASKMMRGADEQLGGEKVTKDRRAKTFVPFNLNATTDDSNTVATNQEITLPVGLKGQPRDDSEYLPYEWLTVYARVKNYMDVDGMNEQDALRKEQDEIEAKLNAVYPWVYSKFEDIPDTEEREKLLRQQDIEYFEKYGDFFKMYMTMHAGTMNPPIVEGSDIMSALNADNMIVNGKILQQDINMTEMFPMTRIQGLFYKFISVNDLEEFDFNKISENGKPLYLFAYPSVSSVAAATATAAATVPSQSGGADYVTGIVPHVVSTSPMHPVEKGGVDAYSPELANLAENNERNPYIREYTNDNFKEIVNMFKSANLNVTNGITYKQNIESVPNSYVYGMTDDVRDAFFAYKTAEEANAKTIALGEIDSKVIDILHCEGVNGYETGLSDLQIDNLVEFMDKKTNGLMTSVAMNPYMDVVKTNIRFGKKMLFANPETGYIYTFGTGDLILGSIYSRSSSPRMVVGVYCNFEGMDSAYSTKEVEQSHIILWNNPTQAMRQNIMLGSPRIYDGFFKPIWTTMDGKDAVGPPVEVSSEPVAVAIPVLATEVPTALTSTSVSSSDPSANPILAAGESGVVPIVGDADKKEVKQLSNEKSKLAADIAVPRSITVNVTTTIPGYQEFKLEPQDFGIDMGSDKKRGIGRKTVLMNPQLKLTETAINIATDSARKRQFYDRNLFNTLNNRIASEYMLGVTPIPFDVAVEKGIVGHNIDLTVRTLLAPNSIIYLGGKPYVIYNTEFDESSWKLEPKDIADIRLTMRDIADASIINMQSKKGIMELRNLPDSLKRGEGNSDPIPLKQRNPEDVRKEEEEKIIEEVKTNEVVPIVATPPTTVLNVNGIVLTPPVNPIVPEPSSALIVKPKTIIIPSSVSFIPNERDLPELPAPVVPKSLPGIATIPVPDKNSAFAQPSAVINSDIPDMMRTFFMRGFYVEYSQQNKAGEFKINLDARCAKSLSVEQCSEISKDNNNYFKLIEMMNNAVQGTDGKTGRDLFKYDIYRDIFTLGVNMKKGAANMGMGNKFNYKNYEDYLKKLQILQIAGDGNCFYSCVATAFNLQNAYSVMDTPTNKSDLIKYDDVDLSSRVAVVRSGTEFTPMFIRWTVVNYYRAHKNLLLGEMLSSSMLLHGYKETMKWVNTNKEFVELIANNQELKDYLQLMKDSSAQVGTDPAKIISKRYKQEIEYLLQTQNITDLNRKTIAYDTAESLFQQYSNDAKFLDFNRDFQQGASIKDYEPFSCPTTFEEAENIMMRQTYFAQMSDIHIIQKVFKAKVIALKRMMDTSIFPVRVGEQDSPMIRRRNIGFRIANDIKDDDDDIQYNKVIVVSYEGESHYNLVVFNASAPIAVKNARTKADTAQGVKTRKLFGGKRRQKATRRKYAGGAVRTVAIAPGNYKKAVFPIHSSLQGFLPKLEKLIADKNASLDAIKEGIKLSIPRFDNLEKSMPIYMYILAFTSYNQIKEREESDIYSRFRSFYADFKVFDSVIDGIFDNASAKAQFISTYEKVFNIEFNSNYFTSKSSQVEELDEDDSLSRIEEGDEDEEDEDDEEDDSPSQTKSQKGGRDRRYKRNPPRYNSKQLSPSSVSSNVVDILNDDKSNLTFQVNVHLTLMPGEVISRKDIPSLACETRLQAIKMNLAKIMGRQYFPTPRNPPADPSKVK